MLMTATWSTTPLKISSKRILHEIGAYIQADHREGVGPMVLLMRSTFLESKVLSSNLPSLSLPHPVLNTRPKGCWDDSEQRTPSLQANNNINNQKPKGRVRRAYNGRWPKVNLSRRLFCVVQWNGIFSNRFMLTTK